MAYTLKKGRANPMRFPIFSIRALVIVTLLFIAGPVAAQETTRERLIGTWWFSASQLADESESSEFGDSVIIVRIRDDGIMTFNFVGGSYQLQMVYARWELEGDEFTYTPVRSLGEPEPSEPPSTVMIAFEDEALVLTDPASGIPFLSLQPGIPPQAIPEGNALSGTVTYSDGLFDEIVVVAYRFESLEGSEDMFPVVHGAAILLVEGEWQILGLEDGVWSVEAIVIKYSGDSAVVVGGSILPGGGVMDAVNDGSYGDADVVAKTAPGDFSNSFPLKGGQQVVTGIDLAPRSSETAVEATTWGEVKARSR